MTMGNRKQDAGTPPDGSERRRFPRYEALGRVLGVLVAADLPVRIRDVGLGGFSAETVEPLSAGEVHRVRFLSEDDWSGELVARSLHCRPSVAADGTPRYVTGFEFLAGTVGDASRIARELITKVTSVELFDGSSS